MESISIEDKVKDYDLFSLQGAINSTTAVSLAYKGQNTPVGGTWTVTVPNDFILKIKNGYITNTYTSAISVTIQAYNGTTTVPLLTVEVPAGTSLPIQDTSFSMSVMPGFYLQVVSVASATGSVFLNAYFTKGGSAPF